MAETKESLFYSDDAGRGGCWVIAQAVGSKVVRTVLKGIDNPHDRGAAEREVARRKAAAAKSRAA